MICFTSIGTYETFEALSRQISMQNHRDFCFVIIQVHLMTYLFLNLKIEIEELLKDRALAKRKVRIK